MEKSVRYYQSNEVGDAVIEVDGVRYRVNRIVFELYSHIQNGKQFAETVELLACQEIEAGSMGSSEYFDFIER